VVGDLDSGGTTILATIPRAIARRRHMCASRCRSPPQAARCAARPSGASMTANVWRDRRRPRRQLALRHRPRQSSPAADAPGRGHLSFDVPMRPRFGRIHGRGP
jgi:hypothetical protein